MITGVATITQATIGVRLPVVQGCGFAYLPPIIALMTSEQWRCPQISTNRESGSLSCTLACDVDVLHFVRVMYAGMDAFRNCTIEVSKCMSLQYRLLLISVYVIFHVTLHFVLSIVLFKSSLVTQ